MGVYNRNSIKLGNLFQKCLASLDFACTPKYIGPVPQMVTKMQRIATGIPNELFNFAAGTWNADNDKFESEYPEKIPAFQKYQKVFFKGIKQSNPEMRLV